MTLLDLMNQPGAYPFTPGFKSRETSRQAGASINSAVLQAKVLEQFRIPGMWLTADEVADRLGIDKLSIRPRISELSRLGKIMDAGCRRKNASGKSAIVWRLV